MAGNFEHNLETLVPSLREVVEGSRLSLNFKLLPPEVSQGQRSMDRHKILIGTSDKQATWQAPKLSELFRGNRIPPNMDQFPQDYLKIFVILELAVLQFSVLSGSRPTDKEMEEIYSNLRRRPDGRSLGMIHDGAWQAAALWMGSQEVSQAEFEAVINRFAHSAASFRMGLVSRNYMAYVEEMFEKMAAIKEREDTSG